MGIFSFSISCLDTNQFQEILMCLKTLFKQNKNSSVTSLALNHSLSFTTDNLEFIQRFCAPYCAQKQIFSKKMFLHVNDLLAFSKQLHVSIGIIPSVSSYTCL